MNIQDLEKDRLEWSLKTFKKATPVSSLKKLKGEVKEVELEIIEATWEPDYDFKKLHEEYADCLMCLFDSAGRLGITPDDIFAAFALKLEKNKSRVWVKNADNTYSHVKG